MIKNIQLTNFRNHETLRQDLDKRVLIIGPNGSGKSTTLDAIEWALRGRCRGVNGQGAGQKDLIRNGADDAAVTLTADKLGPVTRSISRGGAAKTSMATDMILDRLAVSDGMLAAVLSGRAFFDMHHADAKALLMDLLDVRVDPKDLPGCGYDEPVDLPTLEAGYKSSFDQRATQKKIVDAINVPDFKPDKKLDKANRDMLLADQRAAKGRYEAAVEGQSQARRKVETLTDRAARIRKDYEQKPVLQGKLATHQELRGADAERLATAELRIRDLEAEGGESLGDLRGQATAKGLLVDQLKKHSPDRGCVLDAAIPCLTAAAAFQDQVKGLIKDVKTLEGRIAAAQKRTEELSTVKAQRDEFQRSVTYATGQIEKVTDQIKALDDAFLGLADLDQQVVTAKQAPELADGYTDAAAAEHTDATQKVTDLTSYLQRRKDYETATTKLDAAKADLATLEARVKLLGPKGIRQVALQQAVGAFEDAINAALDGFGFELSFQVDPFDVLITSTDKGTRRFTMLSGGEQLWTGLAFQLALAMVSGLNFCLLDATEAVVGHHRQLLTDLVMAAPVDQVIVAMAKGDDDPAPALPGLQVIRFEAVATATA